MLFNPGLFLFLFRDAVFAGDAGLAEATTGDTGSGVIFLDADITNLPQIFLAPQLVVTLLGDGSGGTAGDTGFTGAADIEEAVGVVVGDGAEAGGEFQVSNDTTAAVGDTAFGDKAVGEAEGAVASNVGDVPFGPV